MNKRGELHATTTYYYNQNWQSLTLLQKKARAYCWKNDMPRSILLYDDARVIVAYWILIWLVSKYIHVSFYSTYVCFVHALGFHNLNNNICVLCNFIYLYYQWNPNIYVEKRRKVVLWCFFMNETSEKFTIHLLGSKPKYHTHFSIEFGKIRLCYGQHISKFTK